jgi:hypothetical protein
MLTYTQQNTHTHTFGQAHRHLFLFFFLSPFFVKKDINNTKKNSSLKKTLVLPDTLAPGENSLLLKAGNTN